MISTLLLFIAALLTLCAVLLAGLLHVVRQVAAEYKRSIDT